MNCKSKILIGDDSRDAGQVFKSILQEQNFLVYTAENNARVIIERISVCCPDIVVLDTAMEEGTPTTVMETKQNPPVYAIVSDSNSAALKRHMYSHGASLFLSKPFDMFEAAQELQTLVKSINSENYSPNSFLPSIFQHTSNIEMIVTECVRIAEVPAHLRGYRYLRQGITLAVENPDILCSVSKGLYPAIAELYQTTPICVERAIHNALVSAWKRRGVEHLYQYLNIPMNQSIQKAPSNTEFIATVADGIGMFLKHKSFIS